MQLNPSEISDLIKTKIQNLETGAEVRTQGTVVSLSDGIARIHGLSETMQGEMIEFPNNTFGLALNLERDSVGADGQKERFLVAGGKLGIVERHAHFPIARDRRRDPQHLRPDGQRVLLARELERRLGVGSGNGDLFSHGAV